MSTKRRDAELARPVDTSKLDIEEVLAAAEGQMFGDSDAGFCTECGEEAGGCEPDARRYRCEACGAPAVYGASELVLMMVP